MLKTISYYQSHQVCCSHFQTHSDVFVFQQQPAIQSEKEQHPLQCTQTPLNLKCSDRLPGQHKAEGCLGFPEDLHQSVLRCEHQWDWSTWAAQHSSPARHLICYTPATQTQKRHNRAFIYLLCCALVPDHFLNEVLGLAIGVCAATRWMLLINGEFLWVSVDGGRTAEYQITHPMRLHHLIQTHTEPQPVRHSLRAESTNMHKQTPNCTKSGFLHA